MTETKVNPDIEFKTKDGQESLYFKFVGKLLEQDARTGVRKWKELLENRKGKCVHIWDCQEMTGYEPMARSIWQKTMKEIKDKIDAIWLISDSSVIIAGARLLSVFTSFDIKAVKSEDQILF